MKDKDSEKNGQHDRHKLYRQILVGLLAFVFLVLIVILVVWLVLRPTKPKFYLQDATVYAFNRSRSDPAAANLLTTTIQVTLSTRNPNDRIGIYYDKLDIYAAYKNQQITLTTAIMPAYQGHNDVIIWSPFLYGVNVPIAPYLSVDLGQDQSAGVVMIYVKVDGRLRWKVGSWTSDHYHVFINCPVLLTFNGRGGGSDAGGYSPVIRFQQVSTCTVDV